MNYEKTKLAIILILAIILTIIALFFIHNRYKTIIVDIPKFDHKNKSTPATDNTPISATSSNLSILNLKSLNLPVPFTPQAPTANWDELHNEACEEASVIMAKEYFNHNNDSNLSPQDVEKQIAILTEWQDAHFGYHLDTTAAETAEMARQVYGLQTKLIDNFSENALKNELAQNRLVLISENGRLLGNPYYKRPGPIHHMLVIKGYGSDKFITNDPGTKRGLNYPYDFKTLYNAAADWVHGKNTTDTNIKTAIVLWK